MRLDQEPIVGVRAEGASEMLNVGSDFYLGGVPSVHSIVPESVKDPDHRLDFEGEIMLCQVNDKTYDLSSRSKFTGRNIVDSNGTCFENGCLNHAACEPKMGLSGVILYGCICPLGWIGDDCNTRLDPYPSAGFNGKSYFAIQDDKMRVTSRNHFEINFRTRTDGMLLWYGKLRSPKSDHIAMGIKNGKLFVSFSIRGIDKKGSFDTGVFSLFNLTDGQNHKVTLERLGQVLTFFVDGNAPHMFVHQSTIQSLNTDGYVYLGGFDGEPYVLSDRRFSSGLDGCLWNVKLSLSQSDFTMLTRNTHARGANIQMCNIIIT